MAVTFKKNDKRMKGNYYDIIVTIPTTSAIDPIADLNDITKQIIQVLRDANMDGRSESYFFVLDLLDAMVPDMDSFKSLTEGHQQVPGPAVEKSLLSGTH